MKKNLSILFIFFFSSATAQSDSLAAKIPLQGMDLTWINGQNRQTHFPLVFTDKKTGETIFTASAYFDGYFNTPRKSTVLDGGNVLRGMP